MLTGLPIAEGPPERVVREPSRRPISERGGTVLQSSGLHVRSGTAEAVRGVSVSAVPGRITLVLGINGASKTSTRHAVAGLVPVHGGRVTLGGTDITGSAPHKVVRDGVVLVPEGDGYSPR